MQVSLSVLKDGNAGRLFVGQLISQTCDKMMSVGLVWMFTERYPASVIPWFLGISALPHLLLAWHAGHWSAKFGQLKTLIGTDLFRGLVFILLAVNWHENLPLLFGASFVANLASALFNPAIMSAPTMLGDEGLVQQLTALIESCFNIGNVLGPLLSALLYPWLGLPGLFLVNGVSYVVAAVCEAGIRPVRRVDLDDGPPPSTAGQVLRADTLVAIMLAGFLASNLFLAPIMVIMPLFVKAAYHGGIDTLAGLEMCFGVGTIVGGLFLALVRLESKLGAKITVGMIAVALAYLSFVLSRVPWAGDVSLGLLGFFLATTNVLSMTVFQTRLSPQDVPSLMSLVNLIGVASLPVSMVVVGMAVGRFDINSIAMTCAGGLAIATVGVLSNQRLRQL